MASSITYTGNAAFDDLYIPTPTKNEYGIDVIERKLGGAATNSAGSVGIVAYLGGLAQGQTYSYSGNNWYLQTYGDDKNPIFPTVSQIYKGLVAGIPDPFVSGESVERTMSKSTASSVSVTYWDSVNQIEVTANITGTLTMQYITRRTTWKYIYKSNSVQPGTTLTYIPPSSPKYTNLDVNISINVILSTTVATGGLPLSWGSDVPLALAAALSPVPYLAATTSATPIWGTPYFEVTDVVDLLLE